MSEGYIREIINNHRNKGMLEEATAVTIIDNSLVKYNKYSLKLHRINGSSFNTNFCNAKLDSVIKKDSNLYKEIREFRLLIKFLNKLRIYNGYVRKMERPDFELSKNGISYGIEVTRLYTSNDWVAEKVHNDIIAYNLSNAKFKEYLSSSKYKDRVNAFLRSDEIKIRANKEESFEKEDILTIKNKIFEKIRKQLDEYTKFDFNYIFAEIVYTGYRYIDSYESLNEEIGYYVSHLDVNFDKTEFHLVLKTGNVYCDFDIKNKSYRLL